MRAYFFGNMYLSSIQQGIQSAHCLAEMFVKYPYNGSRNADGAAFEASYFLSDWATDHKTMILLNGGYSENLRAIIELFNASENPYPWSQFHEGQDALDGALTCVGIILPEKIYDNSEFIMSTELLQGEDRLRAEKELYRLRLSGYDRALCEEISKYGLAK